MDVQGFQRFALASSTALALAATILMSCGGGASGTGQPDAREVAAGDSSGAEDASADAAGPYDGAGEVSPDQSSELGPEPADAPAELDAQAGGDGPFDSMADLAAEAGLRVPGEWEPQAAAWMQWPTEWEASLRPDFGRIIAVIQLYQPVHLLVFDGSLEQDARQHIGAARGDPDQVVYHPLAYDNSWMRDNGPVYAIEDGELVVQDWGFDAWGGNFGVDIPSAADDAIPPKLAELLDLQVVDYGDYVLERGNLEANGAGTVVLGWDCQADRNPGWDEASTNALLAERLGATQVIWISGHDPQDLTTGHIDGIVRFVNETTVAVARSLIPGDPNAVVMEEAAQVLAQAGFQVVRIDVPGLVPYKGEQLPAIYMNWLVGNGFVAAMAFGKSDWDDAARATLEGLFPGRKVHMIETLELWYNGGGIHCVTNDQPVEPPSLP